MSRYLYIPVAVECQNCDCLRTIYVGRTKHVSNIEDVWQRAENQADELGWKIDYNMSLCPSCLGEEE